MRAIKVAGGFALMALGVIMLVTPGPGWLAIAAGVGLLSAEFEWARRLRDRAGHGAAKLKSKIKRTASETNRQ